MSECAVYRMYDDEGALLYVGMSVSVPARLAHHRTQKEWWPEVVRVDIEHFAGRKAAAAAESRAISHESPRHNIEPGKCVTYDTLAERDAAMARLRRGIAERYGDEEEEAA